MPGKGSKGEPLPKTGQDNTVHLNPPIPEIAIDRVRDLRMLMQLTPSGHPHLNFEPKLAEL